MGEPIETVIRVDAEPVVEEKDGVRVRLGISDQPTQVKVRFDARGKTLSIDFVYPAGMLEDREPIRANLVEVFVGRYSKRLLGLVLTFQDSQDLISLAKSLTRELAAAVSELKRRTENSGTRMNRIACARDLKIDAGSIPPPWMLETLDRAYRRATV